MPSLCNFFDFHETLLFLSLVMPINLKKYCGKVQVFNNRKLRVNYNSLCFSKLKKFDRSFVLFMFCMMLIEIVSFVISISQLIETDISMPFCSEFHAFYFCLYIYIYIYIYIYNNYNIYNIYKIYLYIYTCISISISIYLYLSYIIYYIYIYIYG